MPPARLELARPCGQRILSPQRLPFRHGGTNSVPLQCYQKAIRTQILIFAPKIAEPNCLHYFGLKILHERFSTNFQHYKHSFLIKKYYPVAMNIMQLNLTDCLGQPSRLPNEAKPLRFQQIRYRISSACREGEYLYHSSLNRRSRSLMEPTQKGWQ